MVFFLISVREVIQIFYTKFIQAKEKIMITNGILWLSLWKKHFIS